MASAVGREVGLEVWVAVGMMGDFVAVVVLVVVGKGYVRVCSNA